jgi:RES domain-containing protein
MVVVWRLVPSRRASDPWSGEGARLFGGRWNEVGIPAVYTSAHQSLAALEVLVHLGGVYPDASYKYLSYELEDSTIHHLSSSELSPDWREEPPFSTMVLGSKWAREKRSFVLSVPSAVIPEERNFILNPEHPQRGTARVGPALSFSFDSRLFSA